METDSFCSNNCSNVHESIEDIREIPRKDGKGINELLRIKITDKGKTKSVSAWNENIEKLEKFMQGDEIEIINIYVSESESEEGAVFLNLTVQYDTKVKRKKGGMRQTRLQF